jgi:hypothetical protein
MWLIRLLEHLLLGQKILVSFAVVRISIWTWWYCFDDDEEEGDEEEAFADVVVATETIGCFCCCILSSLHVVSATFCGLIVNIFSQLFLISGPCSSS